MHLAVTLNHQSSDFALYCETPVFILNDLDISISICPLSIKNHAFKKTEDDVTVTRNEAHAQLKLYRLFVVCQGW